MVALTQKLNLMIYLGRIPFAINL